MNRRDRNLGMDRSITRRDFLNGVGVTVGGSLLTSSVARAMGLLAPDHYPPAMTGLRGSHDGSWEVAHSMRDGKVWDDGADTGESYDLVVVGGGISGLSAAYFYRKVLGSDARIAVDEISWVQTSYLIAEVIMIPLSGMLSRVLSTRWMFTISAGGFTLMSLLCATATSIEQMIVYRALQGFIGGGMIPTVFASAYSIFRGRQALISPVIGLVATLAPTIGPTIGGYLTDLFSWHWLFLVNVVPGHPVTVAAWLMIDFDEPDLRPVQALRLGRPRLHGGDAGLARICARGRPGDDWFRTT